MRVRGSGEEKELAPSLTRPFKRLSSRLSSSGLIRFHHHHQSLFIHEIVSFYMVFLGIVFKTRLKYSKELLTIMLKIQKLTLLIIRVTMGHGVLE